jgi:ribosomal protein L11 methyltransferase
MRTWPALEIATPDDLVQAALTDFDVAAIDDNAPDTWRVFFHAADTRDLAAAVLRRQFPSLSIAPLDVPDEDWAARSQANLQAVQVGSIIVAPPWDVGRKDLGSPEGLPHITIVIQPSMGFGTGHHATTRLCLSHLQQLDLQNRTALDVGTGSGVLAIAASRLGATRVLAIDDDPDAIQSARENVELNLNCEVTLGVMDLRRAAVRPFDVVLANLTGALLVSSASILQQLTAPGGNLVLSGFMIAEEAEVLAAFTSCTIERRTQEDEWGCVTLLRSR